MTKLTNIKPKLSALAPRLVEPVPLQKQSRSRYRDAGLPWRAWYKTYRWQKLREVILLRDNYTCQVTSVVLSGKHPEPNSAVVDHIKPHRGNEKLFWDPDNLQAVSKEYHDSLKQKEEQASLHMRGCWD